MPLLPRLWNSSSQVSISSFLPLLSWRGGVSIIRHLRPFLFFFPSSLEIIGRPVWLWWSAQLCDSSRPSGPLFLFLSKFDALLSFSPFLPFLLDCRRLPLGSRMPMRVVCRAHGMANGVYPSPWGQGTHTWFSLSLPSPKGPRRPLIYSQEEVGEIPRMDFPRPVPGNPLFFLFRKSETVIWLVSSFCVFFGSSVWTSPRHRSRSIPPPPFFLSPRRDCNDRNLARLLRVADNDNEHG